MNQRAQDIHRSNRERIEAEREAMKARFPVTERLVTPRFGVRLVTSMPKFVTQPGHVKRPRYFHDADADLRGRIARQGLTAGFLGDPPPGRSALDQREASK